MERGGNKTINAIYEAHMPNKARPDENADAADRFSFCQLKYEQKVYFSPTAAQKLIQPPNPSDRRVILERWLSPFTPSSRPVRMPRRSSMPAIVVPFSSPKTSESRTSFDDSSFEVEPTSTWWEPDTPTSVSTLSQSVSLLSTSDMSSSWSRHKLSTSRPKHTTLAKTKFEMPSSEEGKIEDEEVSQESSSPRSALDFPAKASPRYPRRASMGAIPLRADATHEQADESRATQILSRSRYPRRASMGTTTPSKHQATQKSPIVVSRSRYQRRLDNPRQRQMGDRLSTSNRSSQVDTSEMSIEIATPRRSRAARRSSLSTSNHSLGIESGNTNTRPTLSMRKRSSERSLNVDAFEEEKVLTPRESRASRRNSLSASNHCLGIESSNNTNPRPILASARRRRSSERSLSIDGVEEEEKVEVSTPRKSRAARRNSLNASNHSIGLDSQSTHLPSVARQRNSRRRLLGGKQNSSSSIRLEDSSDDDIAFDTKPVSSSRLSISGASRTGLITPRESGDKSRQASVRMSLGFSVNTTPSGDRTNRRSSIPPTNGGDKVMESGRRNSMLTESTDKITVLHKTLRKSPTSGQKKLPPSLHTLLCKGSDDEKTFVSGVTTGSSLESSWSLAKGRWNA